MAKVIGVIAVDAAFGIGNEGKLLPFPREDMIHFQNTVRDNVIVCTGSTYKQMRKSLGTFFVFSRTPVYYVSAQKACSSAAYLLNKAKQHAKRTNRDVYLCGGTRLYELLREEVDEWLITMDTATYPSDAKLPWIGDLLDPQKQSVELYATLTPSVSVFKVIINANDDKQVVV